MYKQTYQTFYKEYVFLLSQIFEGTYCIFNLKIVVLLQIKVKMYLNII